MSEDKNDGSGGGKVSNTRKKKQNNQRKQRVLRSSLFDQREFLHPPFFYALVLEAFHKLDDGSEGFTSVLFLVFARLLFFSAY
jgi:hypothetical protein